MMLSPKIFKAYDIRGIYPDEINESTLKPIIRAIYAFLYKTSSKNQPLTVVLGYDMRLSSPQLFATAKNVLTEMGAAVIDIGLISTPSFYFSVFHYGFDAGIQITASHNPKEYNGLKLVRSSPKGLIKIGKSTGMDDIKQMAMEGVEFTSRKHGTVTQKTGILQEEVGNALALLGNPKLKYFKIVADPANAMGAQYIEALFRTIPADLIKMNFTLDGSFPVHPPDPLDFNNLKDLQKRVIEENADFGLAPDGDGDRLFFIDDKGAIVPATIITALVARELLKKNPGATILFDIRYILTPGNIIKECGGKYEITKVGHAFITEKLNQTGGIFAGESSAHYFYKASGNAESQLITIVSVLKVLSQENKPLSEIVEELRRSYESGEINFKVRNAAEILEKLKAEYKDGQLTTIDGIAISYPDWRFNVRSSNTEPLLRLNLEALVKEVMEEKKNELVRYIESIAEKE